MHFQEIFPKGPESIKKGQKVKINVTKHSTWGDRGSLVLLEEGEKKKKGEEDEKKKKEARARSPARKASPPRKPKTTQIRNARFRLEETTEGGIVLKFRYYHDSYGRGKDAFRWKFVRLNNDKVLGVPFRGLVNYRSVEEIKGFLNKSDVYHGVATVTWTKTPTTGEFDCTEIHIPEDVLLEVDEDNNNERVEQINGQVDDLLQDLGAAQVQEAEEPKTPVPLKEDREITKANIARSPLSEIPEAVNEDFVSVAVDTILEANNITEEPIPMKDEDVLLIDISAEPEPEAVEKNEVPLGHEAYKYDEVPEPVKEFAQETVEPEVQIQEPEQEKILQESAQKTVESEVVPEPEQEKTPQESVQKVIEPEVVHVPEVEQEKTPQESVQKTIEAEAAQALEPKAKEIPEDSIELAKAPEVVEPDPVRPMEPQQVRGTLYKELSKPTPVAYGDTVNTLKSSGHESPQHTFSTLELREYTEKVIRFTLNELRRDDFITTLVSKRYFEQGDFQAYNK